MLSYRYSRETCEGRFGMSKSKIMFTYITFDIYAQRIQLLHIFLRLLRCFLCGKVFDRITLDYHYAHHGVVEHSVALLVCSLMICLQRTILRSIIYRIEVYITLYKRICALYGQSFQHLL